MIPYGTDRKIKGIPWVTLGLIAVNSLLLFLDFRDDSFLLNLFSHAGFFHLFFNMLFLWVFGSTLEGMIGHGKFLLYYFISYAGSELLWYLTVNKPVIGSSGAVAGLMGLYLYRCYHSKIKAIIDPVGIFFIRLHLDAKWFLGIFLLRDIYSAFFVKDNIAHWAHVGGFLTGIILGKINRYGEQAMVEKFRESAAESIDLRYGLKEAEENLLRAIEIRPEDPELHLQFGRLCETLPSKKHQAPAYYRKAIRLFENTGQRHKAAEIFLEYIYRYNENGLPIKEYLKHANTFAYYGEYENAAKTLFLLIHYRGNLVNEWGRLGLKRLYEYACLAGREDFVQATEGRINELFPDMKLKPDTVPRLTNCFDENLTSDSNDLKQKVGEYLAEATSTPVFWWTLFLVWTIMFQIQALMPITDSIPPSVAGTLFLFGLGISLIIAFSVNFIVEKFFHAIDDCFIGGRLTANKAKKEFNISHYFNLAMGLEKKQQYKEAAEAYRRVIAVDKNHIQATFNLARIYHLKLNRPDLAIPLYKQLKSMLPPAHPYWRDAYEGIKELNQKN